MTRTRVFSFLLLLNFSWACFSGVHAATPDFFSNMKKFGAPLDEAEQGPAVAPERASTNEYDSLFDVKSDPGGVGWNARPGAGQGADELQGGGPGSPASKERVLPGGRMKMSGQFRLAAGVGRDIEYNDSNAYLQEWSSDFLYGEEQMNTYDPAVFDQFLLNIGLAPTDHLSFYTQIVNDPWSWVGTTGEQVQSMDLPGNETIRYNLKYWGANNSTLPEIYRATTGDSVLIPRIKVDDGHVKGGTVAHGFYDFNPGTGGLPFTIPELDIDYEYRPIRKFWMDYTQENWHVRIFPLADHTAALTSDDPLGLSNHKSYWQQSPWLYDYKPMEHFTDGSIKRGYYSDALSFLARDSAGNYLVLLRGASFEADLGDTYIGATVAAPYSPWDEDFFDSTTVPAAIRLKHQVSDSLMVGTVHTFRTGLIDDGVADFNQVHGVDLKFEPNENWTVTGEVAGSTRDQDQLSGEQYEKTTEGFAGQAAVETRYTRPDVDGEGSVKLSYTQMNHDFQPTLARYTNTRYDPFWGQHLTFTEMNPDLEPFRIGDGVDIDRFVARAQWKEKMYKDKFENLFDVRNVHKEHNSAYVETALRNESTLHVNDKATVKTMFRWQGRPHATIGIEPSLSNFYFPTDSLDLSLQNLQNVAVQSEADPSMFTYAGAVQYVFNEKWTGEGFLEVTNSVPDFPRGLLNSTFRDANDRVDGLLLDHLTTGLFGQSALGGVPPYEYFTITRERLIYQPQENLKFTFHAAQNGYKYATGVDDSVNHQGVSVDFQYNKKLSFFFDYTHSTVIDLPHLIASSFTENHYEDHHNVYASVDYRINSTLLFRAEYGVLNLGTNALLVSPYSTTGFQLKTLDTEHFLRLSLNGEF